MKLLIAISFLISSFHPVHVSFTTLELDEKENNILLMSRIFHDDLADDIRRIHQEEVVMDSLGEPQHLEAVIRYYKDRISLRINDQKINPDQIKFERFDYGNMAVRLFFSIPVSDYEINSLTMENHILTGLFHDQSNLLIVKLYNKEESFRLTNDNNKVTLSVE
ncbi:MAG: DUF6702 family protein [Bacteroidales bacterium]